MNKIDSLLTNIHLSSYTDSDWLITSSEEFEVWFGQLEEQSKEAVLSRILVLKAFGPELPRPYSDVLHGSKKYKNLKELRIQTSQHVLRIAFLLTGGDKKGKSQTKFYKDLITEAEHIIEKHEEDLRNERRNQNDGK